MRKVQFCVGVSCWGRGGCLLFVFMKRDLPQTKLNHHRLADWMHDPDVRDEYCTTQLNHPRLDIRFIDAKFYRTPELEKTSSTSPVFFGID